MITVRWRNERHLEGRENEVWLTFSPEDRSDPLADGFGTLEHFDEERLAPGACVSRRPAPDTEIVTCVHEGRLAYEDALGRLGVIEAGEIQRLSGDVGHGERNPSRSEWAHIFRIQLRPSEAGPEAGYEQRRFTKAECRGRLQLVASPDTRGGSLRLHQNAAIYSATLDPGQHVVHELFSGRKAWLHVVKGAVRLGDIVLAAGDGAGVTAEPAVSLTALEEAAILLVDVGEREQPGQTRPWSGQASSDAAPKLTGTALFRILWNVLVDVLGPAATATIVGRAARRALPHSPDLARLAITRVDGEYGYALPPSFDQADGPPDSLRDLFDEIQPLLEDLTGRVVVRHLHRVPELSEWGAILQQ